ncbi:MAG: hypothetical protein ACI9XO_001306 [Paraglaciecola sp.]|jgi:hypothetical protein
MKNIHQYKILLLCFLMGAFFSCKREFIEEPIIGADLEANFYQTEEDFFQALVATYDVMQWGGTKGRWTMKVGLLNTASDDCFAGGSNSTDQPSWVAYDQFSLDPFLGPQEGLWAKYFAGIYRANLLLTRIENAEGVSADFKARVVAEAKFLRAFFYFDLVRFFKNVPLFTKELTPDDIGNVSQADPAEVFAQIEQDLQDAINTFELPETVTPDQLGRITKGAANALLGKVIMFQNDNSRMAEAAVYLEAVINTNLYDLEPEYGDIFKNANEFGIESVFEVQYSDNRPGDFGGGFVAGATQNPTEGNFNVQFFGMRDYSGETYAPGWGFCPITNDLVDFMSGDPRFEHTVIDGKLLKLQGSEYTPGFQNTDYFIKKYAPLEELQATDGVIALSWSNNVREIRYADVLLLAAEALVRGGGDAGTARGYVNKVRQRVSLQPFPGSVNGEQLLNLIARERRMELATEGHRFFDLIRTDKAAETLEGFQTGVHEILPIFQTEIDLAEGRLIQNSGY